MKWSAMLNVFEEDGLLDRWNYDQFRQLNMI